MLDCSPPTMAVASALGEATHVGAEARAALAADGLAVAYSTAAGGHLVTAVRAVAVPDATAPVTAGTAPATSCGALLDFDSWEGLLYLQRLHAVAALFAQAQAAALVEPDDFPSYCARFLTDPEGARRALTFAPWRPTHDPPHP